MQTASALALAAALAASAPAAAEPRSPTGFWLTEDRAGVIEIKPCGAYLCGVIVGALYWPKNGDILRDITGAPQCRLTLLDHLQLHDDSRWHGTVRNPEDGRVYQAEVWVPADGSMRLRGYIGLPLFGSTQIWPPFRGSLRPDCHFG